ncbi:MAG TPA: hypothetical protein VMT67_04290 [Terriglobales bacterium]|nr:hypothetical protein [Terriglobales bacterium]
MNLKKSCLSALACATVIVLAVGSASAATCTNASLKGPWGVLDAGLNGTQPEATVTQVTFDGAGNLTGTLTNSTNGTISTSTFTGFYSVSKNCSGYFTLNLPGGSVIRHTFAIDDAKKGMQTIRTDNGITKAGFALAQGAATCGTIGKKATFAGNLAGTMSTFGPIAGAGQVIFDGKGNISGSVTFDVGGGFDTVSIAGTYTENANCTGTAEFTPQGFTTANFNLVVVNAGKEVLLVETDSGSTVSGTLQQ